MNPAAVEPIARALLYEGYSLYPYRASALKNQHRWTIGGLVPCDSGEPSVLQAECLVVGDESTRLFVRARFLHPLMRTDETTQTWQEATEREVAIQEFALAEPKRDEPFAFPAMQPDACIQRAIAGVVELAATHVAERVFRTTVCVRNLSLAGSTDRDELALHTLASAHVALRVRGGEFVSLTDPPAELRALAEECRNEGVWPVLVGEPGSRDTMLASPIILPDYPRIAPESAGDFFDGTEIDEMLALRVLTLTDDEKRELAADPRTRAILERVEALPPSTLARMHGAIRSESLQPGDRVRLHPRGRADAFDVLLAGKTAAIVSIEEDFEGVRYFAVSVDDDPGRDLGEARQIGHRFFFRADEVEPLAGDVA